MQICIFSLTSKTVCNKPRLCNIWLFLPCMYSKWYRGSGKNRKEKHPVYLLLHFCYYFCICYRRVEAANSLPSQTTEFERVWHPINALNRQIMSIFFPSGQLGIKWAQNFMFLRHFIFSSNKAPDRNSFPLCSGARVKGLKTPFWHLWCRCHNTFMGIRLPQMHQAHFRLLSVWRRDTFAGVRLSYNGVVSP